MAFPINLKLGGLILSLHLIFETLGLAIGFRYFLFLRNRQKDRINDTNRSLIIIGATFGAFFFSRLIGALENPMTLIHSKHILLYLYANKTIVGGLLGALLVVEITKKIIHERTWFNQLLCCLPNVVAEGLSYNNLFRVIIMNFMDAYDFDIRSIKKSCVHIVDIDGKIIPFETMNLFYRSELKPKLERLRNELL